MTGLTAEQRRLVQEAGDRPVRIEDDELHQSYVLIRADVFDRYRDPIESGSGGDMQIPEGIRRSQDAFFRDLPQMLKDRRLRGKYVAYHGDERVKVAKSEIEVVRECVDRGLPDNEYDIFIIEPQSREPEEVDYPSAWYDL